MYALSAGLVPMTPETGTAAFVFRARVIRMFTVPAACTTLSPWLIWTISGCRGVPTPAGSHTNFILAR